MVTNVLAIRDWFCGRQFFLGLRVRGTEGGAQAPLLASPLLTSCCAFLFLTGQGLIQAHDPGVGDPCNAELCICGTTTATRCSHFKRDKINRVHLMNSLWLVHNGNDDEDKVNFIRNLLCVCHCANHFTSIMPLSPHYNPL